MWCHQESNRGHKAFIAALSPLLYQLSYVVIITKKRVALKQLSLCCVVPPGIELGTQGFYSSPQSFALPIEIFEKQKKRVALKQLSLLCGATRNRTGATRLI